MGKINQGILGGVSGKVANVVGGSWKGINYLRSLPVSVANPRTTPQVAQRNRLAGAVKVAKPILGAWIKPLFDRFAIKQSGYNVFVAENIENMDVNGYINAGQLIMGKGSMVPVPIFSTNYTPGSGELTVNWGTSLPDNLSSSDDDIYIAVSSTLQKELQYAQATGVERQNGTVTITIQPNQNPVNLYVYLVARNKEGLRVSSQSVTSLI